MNREQPKIVILEADPPRRNYLKCIISAWGFTPYCFDNVVICLDNLPALVPDLAVYGTPGCENIFRFLASLRLIDRKLPVLILSNSHDMGDQIHINGFAPAITLKENAGPAEIRRVILENIDNRLEAAAFSDAPLFIGSSPEIVKIKGLIPELSRSSETVLLQGEDGTGKELVAKSIYFASAKKDQPFVKVNAAAIPSGAASDKKLWDSPEADPDKDRSGARLLAGVTAGTVFLDRIEFLPPDLQVSLLHIFEQTGTEVFGVGNDAPADVRIIAAADADLEPLVESGAFRKDLYYRLNVLSVMMPPLRKRRDDIPLLAEFFADKFCLKLGKGCFEIPAKLKTLLFNHHWPGNVAELENRIRELVISGDENKLIQSLGGHHQNSRRRAMSDFFEDFIETDPAGPGKFAGKGAKFSMNEISRISKMKTEGDLIRKALEFTDWNRKKTAGMLNISYKSLLNKIKLYDLGRKGGRQ